MTCLWKVLWDFESTHGWDSPNHGQIMGRSRPWLSKMSRWASSNWSCLVYFFWVLGLVWYFVFGTWEWSCKFWVCFLFFFNCEKRFVLKSRSFFGERRITKLEVACWLWQEPGALPSTEVRDAAPAGILRFWMENSMARDGFGFGHIGIRMSLPTVNEPWSEMIVNFVGKNNHDSTTKRHTIAISSNETKRKH